MNFLSFQSVFQSYPVIPTYEIAKRFPGYSSDVLTRWQKNGYLRKLRNGYYRLETAAVEDESSLYRIANTLYSPSYVSLQSALHHYNFIPEGVFQISSVSTRTNRKFSTGLGTYVYRNLQPRLYFGFSFERFGDQVYKMASPEKAVLDFLYLHPQYNSAEDMEELRWNTLEIRELFDKVRADDYAQYIDSQALRRRYELFCTHLENS